MITFVVFSNEVVVGLEVVGCLKVLLQYLCGKNRVMERRCIKILTQRLAQTLAYIISKQKHIYYTFFTIHCMKVWRNIELFCTRQVIFWSEKV